MIILHAGMLADHFALWGEAAQTGTKKARKGRDALPGEPSPPYPFPVQRGALLQALQTALPDVASFPGSKRLRIWLPTKDGLPLPSLAEGYDDATPITLQPWTISTISLPPPILIALLVHVSSQDDVGLDLMLGPDMRAWVQGFQFAASLVARQRILPGLRLDDGGFDLEQYIQGRKRETVVTAPWLPVLRGADFTLLHAMAAGLPGACRALVPVANPIVVPEHLVRPPSIPATETLLNFLGMVADALMRQGGPPQLSTSPPLPGLGYGWPTPYQHAHDRWLTALAAPDARLRGSQAELPLLAEQVVEWQVRQLLSITVPFQLCLRLEEPETDGLAPDDAAKLPWRLRFLVQSLEDPSLLITAEDLWRAETGDLAAQGIARDALRNTLRAALSKVAPLYPPLEEALREPMPTGLDLDLPGAFAFLSETAARLQGVGCVVQVPWWWVPSTLRRRLKLRARATTPKLTMGSSLGTRQLISFDWKVALGDAELSAEELQTLARLKAPLVQVRGQWVQVNAAELQSALDFYKKQANRKATLGDVARLALDEHAHMGDLEVDRVELEGWLAESLGRLRQGQATMEELPPPEGLHATLRPYQLRGYAWLRFLTRYGLGACLADDMGLGKTVTTLALIQRDWDDEGPQPVLIICPMSVVGNWKREAARFTPDLPVLVHHGGGRRKDETFAHEAGRHAIVISSYSLLHRDRELLRSVPWRGVVLDEAQNIKNSETKQAQAAALLPGNYRVALTGTPVENSVADLWALMDFLNPDLLGSAAEFKRSFFLPIQTRQDPQATARLKRLTGPFLLRRLKTDPAVISDLPEKLEMTVFCTLTKEQASLYQAVLHEMETRIEGATGMERRGLILATLTRLKQVCNHPAHFLSDHSPLEGRSGKLARLEAMLEEALAEGDRALIFTQYTEMGDLLQTYLQAKLGCDILYLHGQTPKHKRDDMVERFQREDGPPLFLLSLKAGGLGLNLTSANHVFHFDRWWNPAVENQATDRAFRIGQTRAVQVHKFVCVGTLEERIAELIDSKQEIAAKVVGSGEGWLTELSTDQLRDIFALRADAVED
jgi:superfamily II DNA or RNA helicase